MSDTDRLRALLGESIPPGGADTDTFFTDADITDLLTNHQGPTGSNMFLAAAEGWSRKAGAFANLVNAQEGGSNRMMSDLYTHAQQRESYFLSMAQGRRTTRIGNIQRGGTTIR